MTEMSQHTHACPKCGATLPVEATAGLCPRCLMEGALAQTMPDTLPMANRERPSPAELAPHFPHLDILEYLGRGGMGVVYKARQKSLNRLVALKLLAPESVGDERFAKRFAKEAQALAALNHPNIVTIYDFGQAGGFYYLLMEFVDGVNLRQAMRAARFTPEEALAIVPPICGALQYAHEHGVVHRDIKPENLLLDKECHVKIADFGIAKMLNAEAPDVGVTESLQAGTPQYMAPEQKECRPTDHRADIYSLGVLLYELLTGELPGKPLEPPSKKVVVDVRLDEIVLRALHENPERRYQTVAEVKTLVETVSATAAAQKQSMTTAARRHRLFTRVGIAVLMMSSIAATWTALNGIGLTAHSHKERKQDMNTNTSAAVLASLLAVTGCVETAQAMAHPDGQTDKRTELMERAKVAGDKNMAQFSKEELKEIASLYYYSNDKRKWGSPEVVESLKTLISKYPKAYRTGCGVLYLAMMASGEEQEKYLKLAIKDYSDCWYGDGSQVGALARHQLANYYQKAGKEEAALALIGELQKDYPDAIDHNGRPLVNLKTPTKTPSQGVVVMPEKQSWASIGETKEEALKKCGEPTWVTSRLPGSAELGISVAQLHGEPAQRLYFYTNKEGKCILGNIFYFPKDQENTEDLKKRILDVNSDGKAWTLQPRKDNLKKYRRDGADAFFSDEKKWHGVTLDAFDVYCREEHKRTADKKAVTSDENLTEPERKAVTLTQPYPTAEKGASTDKIAVQYAVIELGKQAGLGYKWDESFKNTDPICRKWVYPEIKNKPFRTAMQELLDPVGLTYELRENAIILKKK